MKLFFIWVVFCFLSVNFVNGQKKVKTKSTSVQKELSYQARRDSVLLQKDYGSIYLTTDKSAKSYSYLNPAEIDSSIFKTVLLEIVQSIKTNQNIESKHITHPIFNTNWTPIYWFNNDYCLYGPSDWMSHEPILITDSTFYTLRSPDPSASLIVDFRVLKRDSYIFTVINEFGVNNTIWIQFIDRKKGVAIWETRDAENNLLSEELKVQTNFVNQFPIIICDCVDRKCEFGAQSYFTIPNFTKFRAMAH